MTIKLFHRLKSNIKWTLCFLLFFISVQYGNSASYTLMSVGESITISQTPYAGGYISKVALAATLDAHLSFRDNGVGDAVITVNSYFDYETTVKLVFVERYQSYYSGRIHNLAHTYYKDVTIRCKYQAPDPSKKPKKVKLPERVRVPLGERVTVEPVLEPYGAVATSSSWDFHIAWTTCHTYPVENSINCQLVGMKLGYGEATITINGDENLTASTIIEVVDPNNPSPDNIIIPDTIEVSVGKVCTISPIMVPEGTSTAMNWYSDNTSIATVEAGRITGKKEGETYVYFSSLYGLRDTCVVRVVNHNGMDDDTDVPYVMGLIEGHEYVDLGLDVLWASYNVGATSIIERGDSFAWSETEPKSDYSKSNYTGNKTSGDVTDISIQGTSQDAAYVQWGSAWCMPTTDQYTELLGKCSFGGEAVNTEGLVKANANNGASIYFPQKNRTYWTANSGISWPGNYSSAEATYLQLDPNEKGANRQHLERYKGYKVRAVSSVDPLTYGIKPTTISLSSPTKVKVTENFVLKYSITPSNATTPLRWYSENPLVASVSSVGVVEAVGVGTTKIWIETANGLKASCDVTVEGISKIEQVFTGSFYDFFLDETGTLWGCGLNSYGILNDGSSGTSYLSPKIVMHDVIHASTGELYSGMTLLTKKDGSLWSAGKSNRGSLLDGNNKSRYYYEKVMDDVVLTAVKSSGASYILKKDGSLWAGASTKLADNVKSVVGSLDHNLVIKNDGTLWAMGENEKGQLGDGTTTSKGLVKIADDVVSAAAGWFHSLFVKKDGTLWGCGSNSSGQLGDGIGESTNTPVKIMDNVRSVSAGSSHTLVVKNDDTLWGFGSNNSGQLGNGTTENISTPIKITDNVASAYAGTYQSFFIRKDGSLWGCGSNTRGELGDGSGVSRTRPVKIVKGDENEVSISTSAYGYATFYSSEDTYKLPVGLKAMVVTNAENGKLTYSTIAEGSKLGEIPLETAVMLESDSKQAGQFKLTPSDSTSYYSGTNLLHGSDEATTTTGDGYHYKLSYGQSGSNLKDVFGWYWGAANGEAFQIEGHKAWLVVSKSDAVTRGFAIGGDATGIESIKNDNDDSDAVYYDLLGRRVNRPLVKGVYIKNGKKIIVK